MHGVEATTTDFSEETAWALSATDRVTGSVLSVSVMSRWIVPKSEARAGGHLSVSMPQPMFATLFAIG